MEPTGALLAEPRVLPETPQNQSGSGPSASCSPSKELDYNSLTKNDIKDAYVIAWLFKGHGTRKPIFRKMHLQTERP
jgi:hypothetical protein